VQETEIEVSIGETVQVGEMDVTILDVEGDLIHFQIEPPAGQSELPVRYEVRQRPGPK